jgi:hypothetical protein
MDVFRQLRNCRFLHWLFTEHAGMSAGIGCAGLWVKWRFYTVILGSNCVAGHNADHKQRTAGARKASYGMISNTDPKVAVPSP